MVHSPSDGTVSVLVLRAQLAGAAASGISVQTLAEQAGIAESALGGKELADPDTRVPARLVLKLWELVPQLTHNESFGLWLAELVQKAPLTPSAWFILSSPSLDAGLERACQFQRLLHDHAVSELVRTPQETRYVHQVGHGVFRAPRHAIEFGLASFVLLVRRATGSLALPSRVTFQHARPANTEPHARLFGRNVEFEAPEDSIAFDRSVLDMPVLTADSALEELLLSHATKLLEHLPEDDSFVRKVERVVAARIPQGAVDVEGVASALALSRRTLQRRLQEEGATFEAVVDDLRHQLAERYLRERALCVQETAFLLGYSDVSAFHRAFVRWTGLSPATWRAMSNDAAQSDNPAG
jgi:AraC-like DNA-binding protein